ncbi:MAG: PqqD family protein, partial [Clostridiales bacterium]|nr:PqqD family protein [Clostridiales bacterium]
MKIKSGFVLREIAGSSVIIPVGERVITFKGMLM